MLTSTLPILLKRHQIIGHGGGKLVDDFHFRGS